MALTGAGGPPVEGDAIVTDAAAALVRVLINAGPPRDAERSSARLEYSTFVLGARGEGGATQRARGHAYDDLMDLLMQLLEEDRQRREYATGSQLGAGPSWLYAPVRSMRRRRRLIPHDVVSMVHSVGGGAVGVEEPASEMSEGEG
jgi:hypothetical protein